MNERIWAGWRTVVLLSGIALALLLFCFPGTALADSPIQITDQAVQVQFPRRMFFSVQAQSVAPIKVLRLTVWQHGIALGSRYSPDFTSGLTVRATFAWDFQRFTSGGYVPPGTEGEYTWHVEDTAGNQYDSPRAPFKVQDETHRWQTVSNQDITVNWYEGDATFGAAIFQRALSARAFLTHQLGIDEVEPIQIFIYADRDDFFRALEPGAAEWTGGRMFPDYGVIMINFAQDNLDWGLRATSHELSHAILHAKIRGPLGQLSIPHWVDEGLAVYNETEDHAADYQFDESFRRVVQQDKLIQLRKLALRFPSDSELANQAYGEAYSAVKFMIDQYGADKFAALLKIFRDGSDTDDALLQVYGMNVDQLENEWRKALGLEPHAVAIIPTLTPGTRPTYEFSAPALPNSTPTAIVQSTVVPIPTQVSEAGASDVPANSPAAPPIALPQTGLCGGALAFIGLAAFGLVLRKRKL